MSKHIGKLTLFLLLFIMGFQVIFAVHVPLFNQKNIVYAQSPTTLSLGLIQSPVISSLDYLSPEENYFVTSALYLPFAAYEFPPSPALEPVLAAGWSTNSNSTDWILNLKSGLEWDNGSPLNATDLWYTFYLENATNGFSFVSAISNFTIKNSTAIEIKTNTPEPNLVYLYCQQTNSYIFPYQTFKNVPLSAVTSTFTNFNNIVADGPFVTYNYTQGENPIVLTANPHYYLGPPYMKELDIHQYAGLSSEIADYRTGTIDALWDEGAYSVVAPLFQNVSGESLYQIAPGAEMGIYLNLAQYPFNMTQFRQALAYATNRTEINSVVNNVNLPLVDYDNLIPSLETQIGLSASSVPTYTNTSMIAKLMGELHFQLLNGHWAYPNGTVISIDITTADQGFGEFPTSQVIESDWANANFSVNVVAISASTYFAEIVNNTGWQVLVGLDYPGYYPSALGNLAGLGSGSGYDGSLQADYAPSLGVPNYNYTRLSNLTGLAQQYPIDSNQSNAYLRMAAPLVGQTVPIIPLFVVYNWQSVNNYYYWGNQADRSGLFDLQALVQPQLWYGTLWTVRPMSQLSSTTANSTGASSVTSSTGSPSSSTRSTAPTSSSAALTTTAAQTTSSIPATGSANNSTLLYAGIIVVVIIIIGAGIALMRRGRRPAAT